MKPKSPFTQSFEQLPELLPLHRVENALLPGGELPLELAEPHHLALFLYALKTDQLIGMVQPKGHQPDSDIYPIGCAGRIRQYRERKDGRLNIMLTGLCRYRIVEQRVEERGFPIARVDWRAFAQDYDSEMVEPRHAEIFKLHLRHYFDRHNMQVDWKVLDSLPIEQVVNNLVLILNLDVQSKQELLEAHSVTQRLQRFTELLDAKASPTFVEPPSKAVN